MRVFYGLLAFASVLMATEAVASEYWEACHDCSAVQKEQTARQSVGANASGDSVVYVMDYPRAELARFRVISVFAPWEEMHFTAVIPEPASPAEQAQFQSTVAALKQRVQDQEDIDIPARVAGSAYDIVFNQGAQDSVGAYISQNLTFMQRLNVNFNYTLQIFGKLLNINEFYFTVVFADGSSARFKLTGLESDNFYDYDFIPGTAMEPDGNVIPDSEQTAVRYVGNFRFPARAARMTTFINNWFGASFSSSYTCSVVASGNEVVVTCRRR